MLKRLVCWVVDVIFGGVENMKLFVFLWCNVWDLFKFLGLSFDVFEEEICEVKNYLME